MQMKSYSWVTESKLSDEGGRAAVQGFDHAVARRARPRPAAVA